MAKLFDEENVHEFWGLSPGINLLDLMGSLPASVGQHNLFEKLLQADAIHILQVNAPDHHLLWIETACNPRAITSAV